MHTGVERAALQSLLQAAKGGDEEGEEESTSVCDSGGRMALQVKVDIQQSVAGGMPSEPEKQKQAMYSSEWEEWRKVEEVEMHGMVENCVYKQVPRPKNKLVVGTKMLYKRKIGQDGEVEKYKCRLVAQGFWQVEGVHYTEKYSPTPAAASIRMFLSTVAAKGGELRHFDAKQTFLKADIDGDIH